MQRATVTRLAFQLAKQLGLRRLLWLAVVSLTSQVCTAQQKVSFNRDVRPILADRCYPCHGPDESNRKGKLRLDQGNGPEGSYRDYEGSSAIIPGSLDKSAIWYRLTTDNRKDRMPPASSNKKPLTENERNLIAGWVREGAAYEDHWAFVTPTSPLIENSSGSAQTIDRFVARKLEKLGMHASPRASKRSLIRRMSFDLTGLPPTRGEIRTFLADDTAGAYEQAVMRMLAKPQYGEHMAKYWLDLVRFADTNGVHHDHFRDMSPYRDWIIRSFNNNLPYDDFVTAQLAGDLYPDPSEDQLTASGFNRLHMIIDVGTALPEESLARNVIDRVTAVGTAFMGLTVQCAVCHDHKYDPFKQKDFYQLFAFFNNLDAPPETGGRRGADFKRGLQAPYINFPSKQQASALATLEAKIKTAESALTATKQKIKTSDAAQKKHLAIVLKKEQKVLNQWRADQTKILMTVPAAMVMKEKPKPRQAKIFISGAYDKPGEPVERATPAFLPPMAKTSGTATRMDFAKWLVSREHPLTARVAVNRFWQQLFGTGLVKTSEDFGTQGEWPSHPDLLDHLAVSFVESGWDVKALMKQIVLSATYQQTSTATTAAFEQDPENRLLARGARFRMDSEMIRDQVLASSGLLNTEMYGKSVKPPQPAGIWKAVSLPGSYPRIFKPDSGTQVYRRSLYTFWKRGMPPPQMTILNAPSRESCIARRERTNTPLQALLLLNESEYLKAARQLAMTTISNSSDRQQRLDIIYETITSKRPDKAESTALQKVVDDLQLMYSDNINLATQLCEGTGRTGRPATELAAWTVLVSTIYNLDISKTRD